MSRARPWCHKRAIILYEGALFCFLFVSSLTLVPRQAGLQKGFWGGLGGNLWVLTRKRLIFWGAQCTIELSLTFPHSFLHNQPEVLINIDFLLYAFSSFLTILYSLIILTFSSTLVMAVLIRPCSSLFCEAHSNYCWGILERTLWGAIKNDSGHSTESIFLIS